MARDPLSKLALDAICELWDEDNPLLSTGSVYDRLERTGQITRPTSLKAALEELDAIGVIRFNRTGPLDSEGISLHGARYIDWVAPAMLDAP